MATIKKSQSEVPAFGEAIARLRTQRELSRSALIKRLDRILTATDVSGKEYSEAWLGRLESGEIVKIPRVLVNALAEALQCTPREHTRLLFLADRNILMDLTAPTEVREVFNYQMWAICEETCVFLSALTQDQRLTKLSDADLEEIFLSALELVIAEHRSRPRPKK